MVCCRPQSWETRDCNETKRQMLLTELHDGRVCDQMAGAGVGGRGFSVLLSDIFGRASVCSPQQGAWETLAVFHLGNSSVFFQHKGHWQT